MSLRDYKITQGDIETKGVVAAPDVMSGDPQANKRIFDRLIREVLAEKFNNLVDELVSNGVEVILKRGDDSIQYIRLNADNVLEVSTDGVEYEATGSSGHLILDANGNTLPQRGKLQFLDGSVEDVAGVTVVKSIGGIPVAQKGVPNGVAELDDEGKVPAPQLPAAMTPAAHAASHKQGGSDPLAANDIGAAAVETGTWTPTLDSEVGSAPTYTTGTPIVGTYIKIGNIVYASAMVYSSMTISDIGTGYLPIIAGLPYVTKTHLALGYYNKGGLMELVALGAYDLSFGTTISNRIRLSSYNGANKWKAATYNSGWGVTAIYETEG